MVDGPFLTLLGGRFRVQQCGGPIVLSQSTSGCCCCPPKERYFRGFENPDTWFKSAFWHDKDECYFQTEFKPDGSIKVTAVEPDDPDIPEGENYCGLFKVTDGSNWFTQQVPTGTYVRRGARADVLGAIWSPPAVGGAYKLISNTKIVNDSGPSDPCKNFGDKIWLELSDEVQL